MGLIAQSKSRWWQKSSPRSCLPLFWPAIPPENFPVVIFAQIYTSQPSLRDADKWGGPSPLRWKMRGKREPRFNQIMHKKQSQISKQLQKWPKNIRTQTWILKWATCFPPCWTSLSNCFSLVGMHRLFERTFSLQPGSLRKFFLQRANKLKTKSFSVIYSSPITKFPPLQKD